MRKTSDNNMGNVHGWQKLLFTNVVYHGDWESVYKYPSDMISSAENICRTTNAKKKKIF